MAYGGLGIAEMGIQRLAVGHFVEALDDSQLRLQVRFSKPAGMSDALMRAREVERILEGEKRHRSVRGSSLEADNTPRGKLSDVDRIITEMRRLHRETKEVHKDSTTVVCFKCNREGHFANRCPNYESKGTRDLPGQRSFLPRCFQCGKEGHRQWECSLRNRPSGNEKGEFSRDQKASQGR